MSTLSRSEELRGINVLVGSSNRAFNVAKSTRNDLTQTFDDGGETVMIMSQQPIIIPGQDRYIVRNKTKMMPISVPVAQKPSSLRGFV